MGYVGNIVLPCPLELRFLRYIPYESRGAGTLVGVVGIRLGEDGHMVSIVRTFNEEILCLVLGYTFVQARPDFVEGDELELLGEQVLLGDPGEKGLYGIVGDGDVTVLIEKNDALGADIDDIFKPVSLLGKVVDGF